MTQNAFRSALYVPASNRRALEKAGDLQVDAVIVDLEDAVGPAEKQSARENLRITFDNLRQSSSYSVIRINGTATEWFAEDFALCVDLAPEAILLPKVDTARDILDFDALLDEAECDPDLKVWAMIETAQSVLNIASIAALGVTAACRLEAFVVGTNDLAKETGVDLTPLREHMHPWLMQIVLAAKAGKLAVFDGVSNDFRDIAAFEAQCAQSVAMGFDGRTLIHPAQIAPANLAFSPSTEEIDKAQTIVSAFELAENRGKGVIAVDGIMVERLHLDQARKLLLRANKI